MTVRKSNQAILFITALLLISSGFVRISTDAGAAIAREVADSLADNPRDSSLNLQMTDDEIQRLLDAFKEREERLDAREADIENRFVMLTEAEAKLDEKLRLVESSEAKLRSTLALAKNASEEDLSQLTSVYENMKPKEAAALFEEMDPQFAAGFVARMRADAAAGILAGLTPETAYSISAIMAGRHIDAKQASEAFEQSN